MSEAVIPPKVKPPITWQQIVTIILFAIAVGSGTTAVNQGVFIKAQNERLLELRNDMKALQMQTSSNTSDILVMKVDVMSKMADVEETLKEVRTDLKAHMTR